MNITYCVLQCDANKVVRLEKRERKARERHRGGTKKGRTEVREVKSEENILN